jgi:hypothetical protein
MEAIAALANSLTSPAKLAFGAYVLLLWFEGSHKTGFYFSRVEFFVVVVLFFIVQIGHDDWLRIVLNRSAERADLVKRKELHLIKKDELAEPQP